MQAISPAALGGAILVVQIVGFIGLWLMRVGERTSMAHSLRGVFIFTLLILGILTTAAFFTMPRASMASGFSLAVLSVLAVLDLRPKQI